MLGGSRAESKGAKGWRLVGWSGDRVGLAGWLVLLNVGDVWGIACPKGSAPLRFF